MIKLNLYDGTERNLRGKSLILYKLTLTLTLIQRDIIIGTLLGAATIPKQKDNSDYNLKFEQTIRQKDYVWHLYQIFRPFVGTPPKVRQIRGGNAKDRESIWFRTYRHSAFHFYYNFFYPVDPENLSERKKRVSASIHEVLTPRAVAYWYMDDGNWDQRCNRYRFNTQSFVYADISILKAALKRNFNLDTSFEKDRTFYLLRIQPHCNLAFCELIKPYILASFEYKLARL